MSLISFKIIFQCVSWRDKLASSAKNRLNTKTIGAALGAGRLKRNEHVSDQNQIFFWREKLDVWRESVWKHAKACVTRQNRESWQLWHGDGYNIKLATDANMLTTLACCLG